MALVFDDPQLEAIVERLSKRLGETPETTVLIAIIEREQILAQAEQARKETE